MNFVDKAGASFSELWHEFCGEGRGLPFLNSDMNFVGKGDFLSELWNEYGGKVGASFSVLWHEYGGKGGFPLLNSAWHVYGRKVGIFF